MDFLLHANMPRSALRTFIDAGHRVWHVRDIGLGDAPDERIDEYARAQSLILVTRDLDVADTRNYPPENSPSRLVLRIDDTSTATEIAQLLQRFLLMVELVSQIPAHLAILDTNPVRFRPALRSQES